MKHQYNLEISLILKNITGSSVRTNGAGAGREKPEDKLCPGWYQKLTKVSVFYSVFWRFVGKLCISSYMYLIAILNCVTS